MSMCLLVLLPVGLLPAADTPQPKEVVGYVVDVRDSRAILLVGSIRVPVNERTKYATQTAEGQKTASLGDVVVGKRVRATLGGDGVATRVTILEGR